MIQLNLVPNVKQEFLKAQRAKRIIVLTALGIGGFFLAIVVILTLSVYVVQKRHIANLETDISSKASELQAIPELPEILTVQSQLKALPGLHAQAPEISRFFRYLSQITPADVVLDASEMSLGGSVEGAVQQIQLTGRSTNFKAVNRYVDTIKNASYVTADLKDVSLPAFPNVVLTSIGRDPQAESRFATGFVLSMQFDPAIFASDKVVTMSIPSIASTVSSKEKPSVFSEGN